MHKELWTSQELENALGQKASRSFSATGVSIDTRSLQPGDLFVALHGDNFDGHHFLEQASKAGAAGCICDKIPINTELPFIFTQDTLKALETMGKYARNRTQAKVIAVTGSVGKTSTKEALLMAFSAFGKTNASQGGLNNHWGLPLSLARIPENNDFAILEMGMNHVGEIRALTTMSRPHVAIITTVADVHRAFFKSTEEIAKAKAEIVEGVVDGGTVILNRDTPTFNVLLNEAKARKSLNIMTFGSHVESDVRLMKITLDQNKCRVEVLVRGKPLTYHLDTMAQHLAFNSLSVLAAVHACDLDVVRAAEALSGFKPLKGRGNQESIRLNGGSFILIDESYNASPVAVKAALSVLGSTPKADQGRRIFIFGDMAEMGDQAEQYHLDIAPLITAENIDLFFSCGKISKSLFQAVPQAKQGLHTDDSSQLAEAIKSHIGVGDVVMVKGSRSMKMEKVVAALKEIKHAL